MLRERPFLPGSARFAPRAGVFVLAAVAPVATWAVCTCGFGDGRFTLAPIAVNGDMADWAPVHADPDNNVCDGPANSLTDRDGNIQSTGRDLTHFAYTWDQDNVYLFTQRFGSSSNAQSFVYYADIDNDGLMETGEPVIGVSWQGSNRNISVYVFTYESDAGSGDPLVDEDGYGDGYTLPGSFVNVPSGGNPDRTGPWGSSDGLQMEFFITWDELGLEPGDPFSFHVSSSNASLNAASFTSQIDDNLSGCGGRLGSTVVPDVEFSPDLALTGFASQTVVAAHTLTNTGNSLDTFDLSSTVSGDFSPTMSYYHDVDNSGTLTGPDVLLTDTDGDGDPDTVALAPSESISLLIAYDIPGGAGNGDAAAVVTTAASDFEPLARDAVTDTIDVMLPPALLVTKQVSTAADPVNDTNNPKAIPGAEVVYTVTVINQGEGTVDADAFTVTDAIPENGCMKVLDVDGAGSGPVAFEDGTPSSGLTYAFADLASDTDDLEFSSDGGTDFGYAPTANASGCDPAITHIRINPKGSFAADIGSGSPEAQFSFRVVIN